MKLGNILLPISIVAAAGILAFVAYTYLMGLTAYQKQRARDMAVDGCMQNARYSWQARNQQNAEFTNTTEEPDRYWYKLCMQEKGYDIVAEL